MYIKQLDVSDIRSFKGNHSFQLSPQINLFVGKNNSGKSTLLRCIHVIQAANADLSYLNTLNRKFTSEPYFMIHFSEKDSRLRVFHSDLVDNSKVPAVLRCVIQGGNRQFEIFTPDRGAARPRELGQINASLPVKEPMNLLVPFFSRRKVVNFEHKTDAEASFSVNDNLKNLYAKIGRLINSDDDISGEFTGYCKKILGCKIGLSPSQNGSEAGIWLSPTEYIPISAMGEGTANILGLIVELCIASGKIFLIEELENDLHPEALKALLELISTKSVNNQFLISTHSNIVVRHLGINPTTQIFTLKMEFDAKLPTTKTYVVGKNEEARQVILQELGYEPFDFGFWKGYLILEESSAEAFLNRILIPIFVPYLQGKIRTISAGGVDNVSPSFEDFNRLFRFTHTSEIYHKYAWVRVDGDDNGRRVINRLRENFKNTPSTRFEYYNNSSFEQYYPPEFQNEANIALGENDKQQRRKLKKELCIKVLEWADANLETARMQFAISAKEIIEDLKLIEKELRAG